MLDLLDTTDEVDGRRCSRLGGLVVGVVVGVVVMIFSSRDTIVIAPVIDTMAGRDDLFIALVLVV